MSQPGPSDDGDDLTFGDWSGDPSALPAFFTSGGGGGDGLEGGDGETFGDMGAVGTGGLPAFFMEDPDLVPPPDHTAVATATAGDAGAGGGEGDDWERQRNEFASLQQDFLREQQHGSQTPQMSAQAMLGDEQLSSVFQLALDDDDDDDDDGSGAQGGDGVAATATAPGTRRSAPASLAELEAEMQSMAVSAAPAPAPAAPQPPAPQAQPPQAPGMPPRGGVWVRGAPPPRGYARGPPGGWVRGPPPPGPGGYPMQPYGPRGVPMHPYMMGPPQGMPMRGPPPQFGGPMPMPMAMPMARPMAPPQVGPSSSLVRMGAAASLFDPVKLSSKYMSRRDTHRVANIQWNSMKRSLSEDHYGNSLLRRSAWQAHQTYLATMRAQAQHQAMLKARGMLPQPQAPPLPPAAGAQPAPRGARPGQAKSEGPAAARSASKQQTGRSRARSNSSGGGGSAGNNNNNKPGRRGRSRGGRKGKQGQSLPVGAAPSGDKGGGGGGRGKRQGGRTHRGQRGQRKPQAGKSVAASSPAPAPAPAPATHHDGKPVAATVPQPSAAAAPKPPAAAAGAGAAVGGAGAGAGAGAATAAASVTGVRRSDATNVASRLIGIEGPAALSATELATVMHAAVKGEKPKLDKDKKDDKDDDKSYEKRSEERILAWEKEHKVLGHMSKSSVKHPRQLVSLGSSNVLGGLGALSPTGIRGATGPWASRAAIEAGMTTLVILQEAVEVQQLAVARRQPVAPESQAQIVKLTGDLLIHLGINPASPADGANDDVLGSLLSLPKGKRFVVRAYRWLDGQSRLALAEAGVRLLPRFVASTQGTKDAERTDASTASALASWIASVPPPLQAPGQAAGGAAAAAGNASAGAGVGQRPSGLPLMVWWLSSLTTTYNSVTLRALMHHAGGAEVLVALLHRGEHECTVPGTTEDDIAKWRASTDQLGRMVSEE